MVAFLVEAMVRRYQAVWNTSYGKALPCQRESGNPHNPLAVEIVRSGETVGHVPRKILKKENLKVAVPYANLVPRPQSVRTEYEITQYSYPGFGVRRTNFNLRKTQKILPLKISHYTVV